MPSIDERVVAMAFENATFERKVATTMATLSKLNTAIANTGQNSGLSKIEADASKVTLAAPMSALDKLKAKLGFANAGTTFTDIENASSKVNLEHPMSALDKLKAKFGSTNAGETFSDIENASNKVNLEAPMSALDKLKAKLGNTNSGSTFTDMENASNKVTLEQPSRALDNLKNKLNSTNAGTTFTDMENAANRINLAGLTNALDGIKTHLSGLETAAAVAFGNIASQAAMKGFSFAKGFTFAPIMAGLHEYQTNLQAIQTIQANTDQPLTKINKSLNELNRYSDQTIYNFGEMARNIGTFTAAGVDLKTATSSIKGIANMAALSGSNSQQASTAMYQLSQAIASGKVGLQDWNSVVNAGMGGKKLQSALATTAIAMGDIKESSVKLEGPLKKLTINGESFRESIMAKPGQKPWLSSDVLVNTLATLDGRFSKAALSAEMTKDGLKKYTSAQIEAKIATNRTALEQKNGVKYTDAQFAALMKLSDSAFKSATEVKTLGQVFDVAKETIGSGWSASFQSVFGSLDEAKKTFTELSGAINGMINANALARNTVLHDWKALGGRTDLIEGIKNAFKALISVLKPVKDAFREVFPAKTGKDLADMTEAFRAFMHGLILGKETMTNLKRTFAGVFAVMHIGWTIVKDLGKVIFNLLGSIGKGSGGFLNFTGGIGDFLVALDKAISKGNALGGFFKGLENLLRSPLEFIKGIASGLAGMFHPSFKGKAGDMAKELDKFGKILTPFERATNRVKDAWQQLSGVFDKVKDVFAPFFNDVKEQFAKFGDVIADGIKNANFDKILLAFQTTFLGGIFLVIKKALGGGVKFDVTGGLVDNIKGVLGAVTGQLTAMQQNVQARTILTIAGAIVVLAAGVYVLSTIDPKQLAAAMTAIAVGLGEMAAALKIMSGSGFIGGGGMAIIAGSMIVLAGAVVILAAAVKIFSTMDWNELLRGLAGVAGVLTAVAIGLKLMPAARIIPIGAGLILVGVGLNLIAVATKIFAEMKWEELGRGLAGIAGALVAIGIGMAFFGPETLLIGPGLIAISVGLTIMAGAISAFGSIKLGDLAKGILGAATAVVALGLAMLFIPPTIGLQAAGLVLLGLGLISLAGAVAAFGNLKVTTLAKGIIAMGAALLVLSIGLYAMSGTLLGSAALLASAAGLAVLVPTLAFLGHLEWGTILKALGALSLSLGVIATVGFLAAPALAALGVALIVVGTGLLLIGTSIFIATKGLALLGENGARGFGILISAITAFIALFPSMVINFVKGLVAIIGAIADVAPKVVTAFDKILTTVIEFIIREAPKLALAVNALITAILTVLAQNSGPLIAAGWKLIQNLLSGLASNVGAVATKAGEIITRFLNALTVQAPRITASGARMIIAFVSGINASVPKFVATVATMMVKFLDNITRNIPRIVAAGANLIAKFLNSIASQVGKVIAAGTRIILRFLDGIGDAIPRIKDKALEVARKFVNALADGLVKLADIGFKAIIRFLHGIANAIRNNEGDIIAAGVDIAKAIVEGLVDGLGKAGPLVRGALMQVINILPGFAKKILGIHSPSTVFHAIGANVMHGLARGIAATAPLVTLSLGSALRSMLIETGEAKQVGSFLGKEFMDGLTGPLDERSEAHKRIDNAFSGLQNQMTEQTAKLREIVKSDRDKLKTELDKEHPSSIVVASLQDDLDAHTNTLRKVRGATKSLMKQLVDEKRSLIGLAASYDDVGKQLGEAQKALDDITRSREEHIKSTTDQYNSLPDPGALLDDAVAQAALTAAQRAANARKAQEDEEKRRQIDQVALYKKAMADKIAATARYAETLERLRALGLDDVTYKKLISEGTKDQNFADQLLAGGKAAVDEINALDAQLMIKATNLAQATAKNLYKAGVEAAQGLVDGLKQRQKDIQGQMNAIASAMVKAIKRQLGIRSPSKVMAEIGSASAAGLVKGLNGASKDVAKASSDVADQSMKTMQDSLAGMSDAITAEIDPNPVITPVLDLSQVKKDAKGMPVINGDVVSSGKQRAVAGPSYISASATSQEVSAASSSSSGALLEPRPAVHFEQNNYSPDPLSNIEIYRQTNNQLSQLKGLVGVP